MMPARQLTFILPALAAAVWASVVLQSKHPAVQAAGPSVQITAPASGFKLQQGRKMSVRVRVVSGLYPLAHWTLRLAGPRGTSEDLASGSEPVSDRVVVQLAAEHLEPGQTYGLSLEAEDTDGTAGADRISILVPDPQYTLLPLDSIAMTVIYSGLAIDGSGTRLAMGGRQSGDIDLLDAVTGQIQQLNVPLQASGAFRLSEDGNRLVFTGLSPDALGILTLAAPPFRVARSDFVTTPFFTIDRTGEKIAFQGGCGPNMSLQYCLYDDTTGLVQTLTTGANTIDIYTTCPQIVGSTPMISGDGSTVAFVTSDSQGVAPSDPPGCYIFAYDVPSATLRHVRTLPLAMKLDLPAISDDGRWLTFTVSNVEPPNGSRDFGAALDLETGELVEPVGGIINFTTFDCVMSGDGSAIVLSTQADLDPRVGNADHNLELFRYDRGTGQFSQITETTGGIGKFPGGCPPYRPQISTQGETAAFFFAIGSGALCQLDGPQQNEADGFTFHRVRAVHKRPGNHAPVLQTIPVTRVEAGQSIALSLSATDADGDSIVFFAQMPGTTDLPPGSDFADHHDSTATVSWPTQLAQAGVYRLRVAAFDEGGGEAVQDVTLAVCSSIVHDGTLAGAVAALFEGGPPAPCHDADLNHDGAITAADAVQGVRSN